MSLLLVGIGNTLRRDDGAGVAVADRFAARPGVRVLAVHQLLPEHVDDLARCARVVFIDAAVSGAGVGLERVAAAALPPGLGHTGDPGWLIGLCEALHGRAPEAWLLAVPADDLGYGEGLSPRTAAAAEDAVRLLAGWLDGHTTK